MKQLNRATLLLAVLILLPFSVFAMSHQDHAAHDHEKVTGTGHSGEMNHHDHEGSDAADSEQNGMSSKGAMLIVGSMVSKGVKGMAHLKNISPGMSNKDRQETHHFMIAFVDEETGKLIGDGDVALKITNPDAKVGEAVELAGMDGHFGADVTLDMQGEYHFRLETKLSDGVGRKYHFHHRVE